MKKLTRAFLKAGKKAGFVYLAAITPRLFRRAERMPGKFYAHRGLHDNEGDAPENTLAAFRKAVDAGYGIEMDLQLTKDGQVVAAHDFHLSRICGADVRIDELTYDELQQYSVYRSEERIPLFSDVLRLVDGKVPLIIEMKIRPDGNVDVCRKADKLLKDYPGVYCIESFDPRAVWWYRLHSNRVCRGQLSSDFIRHDKVHGVHYYIVKYLLTNIFTAPDFIAYNCEDRFAVSRILDRALFGCPSYAWTVRSQEQLDRIRKDYDYYIFQDFIPDEEV